MNSVTGTSVARLVIYHWRFSPDNHDRTYGVGYTISSVEANLAVACGAVLTLGPLMRRMAPTIFGSTDASRSRPTPSGYLQQSSDRTRTREQYDMKSFGAKTTNWKGAKSRTEAWSSDENILPIPSEGITKNVNIELAYSEAASLDDRADRKPAF